MLTLMLALCCLSSFAAVKVGDSFVAADGDTYTYTVVDINATTGEYDIRVELTLCNHIGAVTIPSEVYNDENYKCTVEELGPYMWGRSGTNAEQVTGVVIPSTVKKIWEYTFGRTKIEVLNIPASVTYLRRQNEDLNLKKFVVDPANPNYSSDEYGMLYDKNKTELIQVPAKVECPNNEFSVPSSVTKIQTYGIYQNSTLEVINVHKDVTNCFGTYNDNCHNLKAINVEDGNKNYYSIDGVLFIKEGNTLNNPTAYPANALSIYPRKKAGDTYNVPAGTVYILENAFLQNYNVKKVVLAESVTTMRRAAFNSCNNLTDVVISKNVTDILTGNPFVTCIKLANIIVDEENDEYKSIDGVLFNKAGDILLSYPYNHGATYTVPEGTTRIDNSAFHGVPIENVTFPSTLEVIGKEAFNNTKSLKSVTFNENSTNFTTLEDGAFYSSWLTNITLPASTTTMGERVFYGSKLTSFTAPESMTTIGTQAFYYCPDLQTVTLNSLVGTLGARTFEGCTALKTVTVAENNVLTELAGSVFLDCPNLESINIENFKALHTIGSNAFENDVKLTSLTFPSSLTIISASSFLNCANLSSVTFPADSKVTTIFSGAFQKCGLTSISLPESVRIIEGNAFQYCDKLKTVNIPAATTEVAYNAFLFCNSLTDINVDKDNTKYSSCDGYFLSKDKETLMIFPTGKARDSFTLLPPSITTIGQQSFYSCDRLTTITIPKKVTKIEQRAFYFCKNLESIAFLGEPVTTIAEEAFDDGTAEGYSDILTRATLYVRQAEIDKYTASDYWNRFPIKQSFYDDPVKKTNEYLPMSANTVNLLSCNADVHTYVIPTTVVNGDDPYNVGLIGDYAFEENTSTKLKELVTFDNVEYIGAKAFKQKGGQTIKNIFFCQEKPTKQLLSTTRFELTPEDLPARPDGTKDDQYKEFDDDMKIYVRRTAFADCQKDWKAYKSMIAYEIPFNDTHIGENLLPNAFHGSFSREFAVDLSNGGENYLDGYDNKDHAKFLAYVPMYRFVDSYGTTLIRVQSINEGGEGDGTYIPANTGVLIRKYVDDSELTSAYYEIADNQAVKDAPEMIKSITVDPGVIPASTATVWNYYIGKNDGLAHKVTKDTNIGIHKAYLAIEVPAGTKEIKFTYDEPSEGYEDVTAIENVEFNVSAPIYNIQGQRVENPTSGLYIVNGKKFYVK